jgi:hypothetical protein
MSWSRGTHAAGSIALVLTILLLSVAAVEVEAATITYTDRAAFNAAVGPTTLLTFDPVVCAPYPNLPPIFCKADYGLLTVGYDSVMQAGSLAPPHILYGAGPNQVNTQLTNPATAIGFDIIPMEPEVQFNLFLSPTGLVGPFTFSAPSFLGIVSTDSAFSGFTIDHYRCTRPFVGGGQPCSFVIDNMSLQVPEPGTFSLFVPGLFLLWSTARARSQRRSRSS